MIYKFSGKCAALFTFLLAFYIPVNASDLCISGISESLLENANAVIRTHHSEVIIESPDRYTIKTEIAVTVLNENGRGMAYLVIPYDGNSRPRFREGAIYDAFGNQQDRIRRRDLEDYSNVANFSLFEDSRMMVYEPRVSSYPYTVRYVHEISYSRGMYHSSNFLPARSYNTSCQNASLTISFPDDINIHYRTFNLGDQIQFEKTQEIGELKWEFENIPAVRREFLAPASDNMVAKIMFAPNHFEYDGYEGWAGSWEEFGRWIWSLNEGRDELPRERVAFLKELVSDLETDREKVKAIYQFMQSRTRYVNVSLGIGGMQPFDAKTVDRVGYGDCKALTNYMMAMLKAVGIESYYTLVMAGVGNYSIVEDFPISQFNHVILSIPLEGDTIWLECTSQRLPFNHLGDFTDNRPVLLITENGGILTRTPAYSRSENLKKTSIVVDLKSDGNGTASYSYRAGGIFFVDYLGAIQLSKDEQERWLYSNFGFPNYRINQYSLMGHYLDNPIAQIQMDISLRSFADISGGRMIVPVNALINNIGAPPRNRNRSTPFELKFERTITDTVVYKIPDGFMVESTHRSQSLQSDFGKYESRFEIFDDKVLFIRRMETFSGLFDPEKYEEWFSYQRQLARAENQNIVLARN